MATNNQPNHPNGYEWNWSFRRNDNPVAGRLTDAVETNQQLQKKLHEQEQKLTQQEQKLGEQEKKLGTQEQKLGEWEQKCVKQDQSIKDLEVKLEEQSNKLDLLQQDLNTKGQLLESEQLLYSTRTFEMRNFSVEKANSRQGNWKSPASYTHLHGYKFCIGVDANGVRLEYGHGISVHLFVMAGEYDEGLQWPVQARFTVGLTSQSRRRNVEYSMQVQWDRPKTPYQYMGSFRNSFSFSFLFINHFEVSDFLINDTLCFYIGIDKNILHHN